VEPAAARFRRYAALRSRILTAAARRVPLASVAQQARALSLWDGKQVAPGDEMQFAMVLDLGVLDPVGKHGRGIDRQAKAEPPPPDSEESRMLAGLQAAEFGLFRLLGPDPEGGVAAERFPQGEPIRIWDNYLGASPPGSLFGARIAWPEADLAMTCGVVVPVDSRVLERLLLDMPPQRGPVVPRHPAPDDHLAVERILEEPAARMRLGTLPGRPGFAARTYRAAIDLGLVGPVPGRRPA